MEEKAHDFAARIGCVALFFFFSFFCGGGGDPGLRKYPVYSSSFFVNYRHCTAAVGFDIYMPTSATEK